MKEKKKTPWIMKAAIIIGVLVIPLLYSYFYLGAFWDPYARLDDVPVAVVNLDSGAVINGEERNLGQEICDNLEKDGTLKFVFTDNADAEQGVLENDYYASITIPKDFSLSISLDINPAIASTASFSSFPSATTVTLVPLTIFSL